MKAETLGLSAVRIAIGSLLLMLMLPLPLPANAMNNGNSVKYWLPHCKALISAKQTDEKGAYLAGECLGMIKASAFIIQRREACLFVLACRTMPSQPISLSPLS